MRADVFIFNKWFLDVFIVGCFRSRFSVIWFLLRRRFKKVVFFTHWKKESRRWHLNETFFYACGISEIFIS
jgi:hypothetical protein